MVSVFILGCSKSTEPNQAPTAAFTSICTQLSCTFADQSSDPDGTVAGWSWSFGDGASSTARNPTHAYGTGGAYTVAFTVTDNQGASSTTTTHQVTVSTPLATELRFGVQPGAAVAGTAISPAIQIEVRDAQGDIVTTSTASITLAIAAGTGMPGAMLAGTLTRIAVNGTATFDDLAINVAGGGYRLAASGTNLTGATSTSFTVGAASAKSISPLLGDNQTAGTGLTVATPPSVIVRDMFNNPKPGITVTFTAASGGGTVSGPTSTTDASGVASVGGWTLGSPGTNTLTATAAGTGISGNPVTFTATASRRAPLDRTDQIVGSQIHIFYVVPSDGVDQGLDTNGVLTNTVGSFQTWLGGQTGGKLLRMDTYQGALDITFVRLGRSNATMVGYDPFIRDTIEKDLATAGFAAANKIYAVYYDGGSNFACGGGSWPPILPGRVGALYLQGTVANAPPCNSNPFASSPASPPGYLEFAMIHELMHVQGFVASTAPNFTLQGHVNTDPTDLMYAGALPWQPSVLDFNKQNYYNPNGLPAGVQNFAQSPFLGP